ncbi:hypothetical protein C8F01DRAFT_1122585 [Mycena amicta]|nr:hypothetical protein C8F01DRAFT_1122585 [Mycena amicta]
MTCLSFLSVFTALLLHSFASASEALCAQTFNIPSTVQAGPSQAQFTLTSAPIDAPKVAPITNSSYDWWYFDVASTDPADRSTVVVTFFTSTRSAFPLLHASDTVTPVYIWGTYPNGTRWDGVANGTSATVVVDGDASSGNWIGTGFSWSAPSASVYLITIDSPELGIKGTISFRSIAPAHLPCGPVAVGQTLQVGPRIGWANVLPDAASVVDLHVAGTHVQFQGTGYHDKNWGDVAFTTNVASWYWGHGRVGPYSIVWFDLLDLSGQEHLSAYVSKNNKIVAASCTSDSIQVRPLPAVYPPVLSTPDPIGYHINIDGVNEGVNMQVDVHVLAPLVDANPAYARFFGNLTAVLAGGQQFQGTALFEQFKLTQ